MIYHLRHRGNSVPFNLSILVHLFEIYQGQLTKLLTCVYTNERTIIP